MDVNTTARTTSNQTSTSYFDAVFDFSSTPTYSTTNFSRFTTESIIHTTYKPEKMEKYISVLMATVGLDTLQVFFKLKPFSLLKPHEIEKSIIVF